MMQKYDNVIVGLAIWLFGMYLIEAIPFFVLGAWKAISFNHIYSTFLITFWAVIYIIGAFIWAFFPKQENKVYDAIIEKAEYIFTNGIFRFGLLIGIGIFTIVLVLGVVEML